MSPLRELSRTPFLPSAPSPPSGSKPSPARTAAEREDGPSAFHLLLRGVAREADRGEATVNGVFDGGAGQGGVALDPAHLLALQAGIYRYGETMDLAARLVEKAATGVKTVVQGQ